MKDRQTTAERRAHREAFLQRERDARYHDENHGTTTPILAATFIMGGIVVGFLVVAFFILP